MAEAELTIDDETQHLFYLNIGSDANNNETLTFVLERDGETIAMTGSLRLHGVGVLLGWRRCTDTDTSGNSCRYGCASYMAVA